MGFGDDLMATGMARGARSRGVQIAFGDGRKIIWGPWSEEIFRGNPNIARPGSVNGRIEWVPYYKGRRIYNQLDIGRTKWVWNYDFSAKPGEMFFNPGELHEADQAKPSADPFVLIEPNVPMQKACAINKDWGFERYQKVADHLTEKGWRVVQFAYYKRQLAGARTLQTKSFRNAMAHLRNAALVIVPEGGLHHAAAAMNVPAVVLFGGFIPPQVTGYDIHTNLTGGAQACGSLGACQHCRMAMEAISVEEVIAAVERRLECR